MNNLEVISEKIFDDIKHVDENGNEYWYARELIYILCYKRWDKFMNVIVKAQNDIVFGIFAKKNTVDYIEIDGSKKFEKNDRVEEDSEVVIYYHSK